MPVFAVACRCRVLQEGQTALRLASAKGCLSLVELLLLVGAQVNAHTVGNLGTQRGTK